MLFINKAEYGRWSFSIVQPEVREVILQSDGFCQDIVQALVAPLQQELGMAPAPVAHRTHGLTASNLGKYDARIAAIDYTRRTMTAFSARPG